MLYFVFGFIKRLVRPLFSPLRELPGPKPSSIFLGSVREAFNAEVYETWAQDFGSTFVFKQFFNVRIPSSDFTLISRLRVRSDGGDGLDRRRTPF